MTLVLSLRSVQESISSNTRTEKGRKSNSTSWELKSLLVRNGAFAPSIRTLLTSGVKGEQFVAWLLYSFGKELAGNSGPMKSIMKTLLDDPTSWPGDVYDRLAHLPPKVLVGLLERAIKSDGRRTGNTDWDNWMGDVPTNRLKELKICLTGEG